VIVLDTSVLIDGLTGLRRSGPAIRGALAEGERIQAVRRPRGREIDLAIAASAILREAPLWTLNQADFRDVPGIRLYRAP
jgi:predicted nucleic acid-binding protein